MMGAPGSGKTERDLDLLRGKREAKIVPLIVKSFQGTEEPGNGWRYTFFGAHQG